MPKNLALSHNNGELQKPLWLRIQRFPKPPGPYTSLQCYPQEPIPTKFVLASCPYVGMFSAHWKDTYTENFADLI